MYRIISLVVCSSFIFSAAISIDKSLFIQSLKQDKYLNARKGELGKKKDQLTNPEIVKFGHNIKLSMNKTYHRNDFSRDLYILLNFECIEGPNTGVELVMTVDADQGEVVVPGWDDNDYVCVIAQNCDAASCSDSVGPVCVYAGSDDQSCVDDSYGCDNQLLGDANNDGVINIIDIVTIVNFILDGNLNFEDCNVIASDFNNDQQLNVLDIIEIVNLILSDSTSYPSRFNTF
jgi:hypothetical protein